VRWLGIYGRRTGSQFNARLDGDSRNGRTPIDRKRAALDGLWRMFLTARGRFLRGECDVAEVTVALNRLNRLRRHCHLYTIGINDGYCEPPIEEQPP